ncbi:MAG: tRNA pseudouridine(13) synthase TruD [Phycisphaerae bacterium]
MAQVYYTAELPGVGGKLKQHVEDFQVQEVPLYKPNGVGTHCYVLIEKRGISTMETAKQIARALGRKTFDIGYAGLKDTRAVTAQWFSIEHLESARAGALDIPHLKVLQVTRHNNKIKMGHLAGNRFSIKLRNGEWEKAGGNLTLATARERAAAIWAVLDKAGVPNFFGPQRFGMRRDNHLLGLALIKSDFQQFADRFLGDPDPEVDHGDVLTARQLYKNKRLDEAIKLWPGHLNNERRALAAIIKGKGNPKKAIYAVDVKLQQLLVSALQSHLFNEVLARRLPKMTAVLPGDLCWKHDNGAVFAVGETVEAVLIEQPRADAHEISPSGPMFGWKMTQPPATSLVGIMESEILTANGLSLEAFRGPSGSHGARRSLRFFPKEMVIQTGTDTRGAYLQFDFTLPSGSYATVLLGEIMKSDVDVD